MGGKSEKRPKLSEIQIEPDDLDAVLEMSITSIKAGRSAKFPNTAEGLEDFKQASIGYLEYVRKVNENPANENKIIPDVECWAVYLGTTRQTINTYERTRDENWYEFISVFKGALTACKKQLAFRQKIPTVLAVFDLTNNSGYVNSSEFKLQQEDAERPRALSAKDLPTIESIAAELKAIETKIDATN